MYMYLNLFFNLLPSIKYTRVKNKYVLKYRHLKMNIILLHGNNNDYKR